MIPTFQAVERSECVVEQSECVVPGGGEGVRLTLEAYGKLWSATYVLNPSWDQHQRDRKLLQKTIELCTDATRRSTG